MRRLGRLPACVAALALLAAPSPAQAPPDVVLPPAEFRALRDQAEQFRRLQDAPKPQPPSECRLSVRLEAPAGLTVAAVVATYTFQAAAPRTPILLGGLKALPRSAKRPDGRTPLLVITDDGLALLAEHAGPGEITVEWEVPVLARPGGAEVGFEIGLPRAAITTLTADLPHGGKGASVGPRPGDARRAPYRAGAALGPTDRLELAWPPPVAPVGEAAAQVESDIAVRIDENRVETTAKLRLRGPLRDWPLYLPAGSDVSVERVGPPGAAEPAGPAATLTRPADAARPLWRVQVPAGAAEWLVTAVSRQPRPRGGDPKARQAVAVGPIAAADGLRHAGALRVYAPPLVRVAAKAGADLRRQELPAGAEEEFQALFRFSQSPASAGKAPPPLAELELRPARGFVRLEPNYRLQLTRAGWRLNADLRVLPVRSEVDSLLIEWPGAGPGAEEVTALRPAGADGGPVDLVAEVEVLRESGPRTLAVRLESPQKGPFDLALSATFSAPPNARELSLVLPQFPQVVERAARLAVAVPEGVEVRGTATARDGEAAELRPPAGSAPGAAVAAAVEGGLGRVELAWQPYRPGLAARLVAEIALKERQAEVTQTVTLRVADGGAWRPVRFKGPAAAVGVQAPGLEAVGAGEWELPPPPAGAREVTQSITYGLPLPPRRPDGGPARLDVPLFWPDEATRSEASVRVWGSPGSRRLARFDGPWREVAPEPDPGRDAWPWLALAGAGDKLRLALDLLDPADAPRPHAWVERALVRATLGSDDTATVRAGYLLRRWNPAGLDVKLPPGAAPRVRVDGLSADNLLPGADGSIRIPLRERTGRPGLLLEVTYSLPLPRGPWGEVRLIPPELIGAAYRDGARWHVSAPPECVLISPATDAPPETRWDWRPFGVGPAAAATVAELEQWLTAPADGPTPPDAPAPEAEAPALTLRQSLPAALTLFRVPRPAWVAANAISALLLLVGVARMAPAGRGGAVAAIGVVASASAAAWPQPLGEAVAAALPGVAAGLLALATQRLWQWRRRRRVTHLPGFTRSRPEVVAPAEEFTPAPPSRGRQPPESSPASQPHAHSGG